jgi:transposase-like protein
MAIGSADNDVIDCTDIAEFYCWPAFPSRCLANRESRSSWKDFLLGCVGGASTASSSSSPTITPAFAWRSVEEARCDLAAWIAKWSVRYPRLVGWVEETIEETVPRQHHKHLKSTNMLERLNEEIRRRTYVVRIFPNADACRRLVRALAVETHENWLEAHGYLNMNDLKDHKKIQLRQAA